MLQRLLFYLLCRRSQESVVCISSISEEVIKFSKLINLSVLRRTNVSGSNDRTKNREITSKFRNRNFYNFFGDPLLLTRSSELLWLLKRPFSSTTEESN